MNKKHTDLLYASPQKVSGFIFDDKVAAVFPDMIQRSVPGYGTIIHMIGQLASRYAQANSQCYDLGCSLGAAAMVMREQIDAGVKVIAVDNSEDMIARCRQSLKDLSKSNLDLRCEDILSTEISRGSVVVLNFTLQFIAPAKRQSLIAKIFKGMLPGGILVLSEKLAFDNNHHNELMVELHHYFKRSNGYSDLEIAQKRAALENVLIPETLDTHQKRLIDAGFKHVDLWFQCFNFVSMIAIK
ncbi:MAG: carboxy-S-adenosyl-L-methionine synthase CmoA [Cellvibrionaceae bacterium]|nr:carboxy-S-adenosyl-L-methionine synthase CmoA [Cellvibrionaceae bacterium]